MNNTKKLVCFVVIFLCLGFVGRAADSAEQPLETVSAETEAKTASEKKARDAEIIKQRREAAEKAKREAAEMAKAKRQEKAKLAKLDAEAKKQAKAEIAQAKADKKARIAELDPDAPKEQRAQQKKQIEAEYREKVAKIKMKQRHQKEKAEIAQLNLPKDTTPRLTVRQLHISGNTLVSTAELLEKMPLVYNSSDKPLHQAESEDLYDFSVLADVILQPGRPRQLSARTIQGFTMYVLSVYRDKDYAGIYVYVPAGAIREGTKLQDEILPVEVIEAPVTEVTITHYDPNQNKAEKGYIRSSAIEEWSPVKPGQVANQKKLDDFVNLLNLNPDRYVSAVVTKGPEPKSLAVGYDIYEADPWHWFVQVDNAGTEDRRYAPRVGLINTNLLGMDDKLTVFYQAPWEKGIEDKYSIYGSYDLPVMGPRLRLELFAGYNQFDVEGGGGIDFLGHGSLYGGKLRYNAFQEGGWFFDVTTSLSREKSKVSSSIFSAILGSEVVMHLWGVGVDVHKRTDMANTSITFDRVENIGGSPQRKFWNGTTGARTNADRDFVIYTTAANHSQYLDTDKVQRLTGSVRWIVPNDRLVPAKMTTFGGMYTVRGYKESGIVADGGILASAQYEYDLVKYDQSRDISATGSEKKPWLRKLAPLAFFDYGRARMEDKVAGEKGVEDMYSVGMGGIVELGDNFSGAVYYGYPLEATSTTDTKDGRLNLSLMMRW